MKQAIRDGHEVTRHPEFLGNMLGKRNACGLEFNETPLAAAVRSGLGSQEPKLAERRRQVVEFLLKRGAATNLPDDEPWATPLAWARKFGLAYIEEILLKHGAT